MDKQRHPPEHARVPLPPVGQRPIDRFLTWGGGRWGMVFGSPEWYLGVPMSIERGDGSATARADQRHEEAGYRGRR